MYRRRLLESVGLGGISESGSSQLSTLMIETPGDRQLPGRGPTAEDIAPVPAR